MSEGIHGSNPIHVLRSLAGSSAGSADTSAHVSAGNGSHTARLPRGRHGGTRQRPEPSPVTPTSQPPAAARELGDYLGTLRRNWWLLLAATVLGLAAGAGATAIQPRVYEASTSVLVLPTGVRSAELANGRTRSVINLDTEAQLVQSSSTATLARQLLDSGLSPGELLDAVSVTVPPNTSILEIRYAAENPEDARAGSHAFAEAYLKTRQQDTEAELRSRVEALDTQVTGIERELQKVAARLDVQGNGSGYLSARQQNLTSQLNTLTERLNELRATPVSSGQIISDAETPTSPSRPVPPLNLAAGLMLGLVAGVGAVIVRQRLDRRVHRGADLLRRAGVPLLIEITDRQAVRSTPEADVLFAPFTPAGRLFHRLRNEVATSLDGPHSNVVVVTGASRGTAAPTLAANLAVAFSRAGSTVGLVYADVPGAWDDTDVGWAPSTRLFGVPAAPGLSEVLANRADLRHALVSAARHPGLHILPTGSTASAAGLLQSETVRRVLAELRRTVDYVIVHAPSTAESADAQTLAMHADAVILAVDLRRTTDAEVADAAEQLNRVGTPLLGAVALATASGRRRRGRGKSRKATDRAADEGPASGDPADSAPADGAPASSDPASGTGGDADAPTLTLPKLTQELEEHLARVDAGRPASGDDEPARTAEATASDTLANESGDTPGDDPDGASVADTPGDPDGDTPADTSGDSGDSGSSGDSGEHGHHGDSGGSEGPPSGSGGAAESQPEPVGASPSDTPRGSRR